MDVKVMDYIAAIKQGQIEKAARISFDCIQCGLCASRCMGEIPQYHIAQLARRVFARYVQPQALHLKERKEEIEDGKYDQKLGNLSDMGKEDLEKLYVDRQREPDLALPGDWMPEDTSNL